MKKAKAKGIKAKTVKKEFILAWHVLQNSGKLAWGNHYEPEIGEVYSSIDEGNIQMCKRGLHASSTPKLALKHFKAAHPKARGPFRLCRVLLLGKILGPYKNKYCAEKRTIISMKKVR